MGSLDEQAVGEPGARSVMWGRLRRRKTPEQGWTHWGSHGGFSGKSLVITAAAVRGQIARVLASAAFARAGRMSRFLRFIAEEILEGRGSQLKEYLIGVKVFDPWSLPGAWSRKMERPARPPRKERTSKARR